MSDLRKWIAIVESTLSEDDKGDSDGGPRHHGARTMKEYSVKLHGNFIGKIQSYMGAEFGKGKKEQIHDYRRTLWRISGTKHDGYLTTAQAIQALCHIKKKTYDENCVEKTIVRKWKETE